MAKVSRQWLIKTIKETQQNSEEHDLSSQEIDEIWQRAISEYERRMEGQQRQTTKKKEKRRGLLRRVVTIAAVAVSLIVGSIVYSVLAPISNGNANNVFRRVAIWINDTLSLGIQFPVPVDDESPPPPPGNATYTSIEEAAKNISVPFAYFSDPGEMMLDSINYMALSSGTTIVDVTYSASQGATVLSCYSLAGNNAISMNNQDCAEDQTSVGIVYSISTSKGSSGYFYYKDCIVQIISSLSQEELRALLPTLTVIN